MPTDRMEHERDPTTGRGVQHRKLSAEDQEWIDILGGKVGYQVFKLNAAAAHEIVDAGIADRKQHDRPNLLSTSLADLGVDLMTANALENYLGITTVEGFLNTTHGELLCVRNLSGVRVEAAKQALLRYAVQRVCELEAAAS